MQAMSKELKDHGWCFLKDLLFMHGGRAGSNCGLQGQDWRKYIAPTQIKANFVEKKLATDSSIH